ncbi:hypothetical protein M3Y99_01015500 [Aphelenchoides fujianensis]|nr:hypothetical protein M3Y99_01015500 [Aphelenchoides fujianensis]
MNSSSLCLLLVILCTWIDGSGAKTDELIMWEYNDDVTLYRPHKRLLGDVTCTMCKKTLETVGKMFPEAAKKGKGPLKAAIPAACMAFVVVSPIKVPFMNKACELATGMALDRLVDAIANNGGNIDPEANCKKAGLCGKKC